jgi:hypothetical protein
MKIDKHGYEKLKLKQPTCTRELGDISDWSDVKLFPLKVFRPTASMRRCTA